MLKYCFLTSWLMFLNQHVTAQSGSPFLSKSYLAFCAYSPTKSEAAATVFHPAALASLSNSGIGLMGENRFMLPTLIGMNASVFLKTSSGNFSGVFGYDGSVTYHSFYTAIAYGRRLSDKLDLGVGFNYIQAGGSARRAVSSITAQMDVILHVTPKMHVGVSIERAFGTGLKRLDLPAVYTIGAGYDVSELVLLSTELVKEEDQAFNMCAGVQYKLSKHLLVRAGIATATGSWWFGAGLQLQFCRLDLINSIHPQLGVSPALHLLIPFKTHKE